MRITRGEAARARDVGGPRRYIVRTGRSDRLRLFLDTSYGAIIDEAQALLSRCFAGHRVGRFTTGKGTTTILSVYCTHLACLFPQHGAGRKHDRDIVLEEWQTAIVEREPWSLLRGLIRSDGCVFVNRTGRYEYLSYEFSNLSRQIRELFMDACDRGDVEVGPIGDTSGSTDVRASR